MGRRRCLDVCKERGERTSPFVRPYENENYEMEKELEKSWGKMGEGAKTVTGGRGARGEGEGRGFNT